MQEPGFYWHVYDEQLLGWCFNYDERAKHISTSKSLNEQKLRLRFRLRLLQPVKGQLPQELVEARGAYVETRKAYDEAWKAYTEARKVYDEAGKKTCDEAREAYDEAGESCDEAREAYDESRKAYDEVFVNHKVEITALHSQECPNCPWDGETIFSVA